MLLLTLNIAHVITNDPPETNDYTADASELGLKPGEWPEYIRIDPMGELLVYRSTDEQGARLYTNPTHRMTIFND